jgi:hypothetical protein
MSGFKIAGKARLKKTTFGFTFFAITGLFGLRTVFFGAAL